MAETELIRKIADDIASLKDQMNRIEIAINEIDQDIHRQVNPQYLKKLEKIRKHKGVRFNSAEEFEVEFSD